VLAALASRLVLATLAGSFLLVDGVPSLAAGMSSQGAVPVPGAWDGDALAPFDPDRRAAPVRPTLNDRDAIVEPLFASSAGLDSAANRGARPGDPDGVLTPTFGPIRRPPQRHPDDLLEPWQAR
jgi:hypothetical protein